MKKNIPVLMLITLMFACNESNTTMNKTFRKAIFLHHSTGSNIYGPNNSSTSVPAEISKYNALNNYTSKNQVQMDELSWPTAKMGWNNEWYRWKGIFEGTDKIERWGLKKLLPQMVNANNEWRSIIKNYPVVIIKSCFPSSDITSEGSQDDITDLKKKTLYNYKRIWRKMVRYCEKHPENFFVIWTNAPLVKGVTTAEKAMLSDTFCTWAKDTLSAGLDKEFGSFPKNVYVFDFFHHVSENGFLKDSFSVSFKDSHPNSSATEYTAPIFVKEVFDAALEYENNYNADSK